MIRKLTATSRVMATLTSAQTFHSWIMFLGTNQSVRMFVSEKGPKPNAATHIKKKINKKEIQE